MPFSDPMADTPQRLRVMEQENISAFPLPAAVIQAKCRLLFIVASESAGGCSFSGVVLVLGRPDSPPVNDGAANKVSVQAEYLPKQGLHLSLRSACCIGVELDSGSHLHAGVLPCEELLRGRVEETPILLLALAAS